MLDEEKQKYQKRYQHDNYHTKKENNAKLLTHFAYKDFELMNNTRKLSSHVV